MRERNQGSDMLYSLKQNTGAIPMSEEASFLSVTTQQTSDSILDLLTQPVIVARDGWSDHADSHRSLEETFLFYSSNQLANKSNEGARAFVWSDQDFWLSSVESELTGRVIGSVGVRISVVPHRKGRNELTIYLLWWEERWKKWRGRGKKETETLKWAWNDTERRSERKRPTLIDERTITSSWVWTWIFTITLSQRCLLRPWRGAVSLLSDLSESRPWSSGPVGPTFLWEALYPTSVSIPRL